MHALPKSKRPPGIAICHRLAFLIEMCLLQHDSIHIVHFATDYMQLCLASIFRFSHISLCISLAKSPPLSAMNLFGEPKTDPIHNIIILSMIVAGFLSVMNADNVNLVAASTICKIHFFPFSHSFKSRTTTSLHSVAIGNETTGRGGFRFMLKQVSQVLSNLVRIPLYSSS